MIYSVNETHDPAARSWVESANVPGTDFPIQNLPFCVFDGGNGLHSIGVGIGDQVLDLAACAEQNLVPDIDEITQEALGEETLNLLMALGPQRWSTLRHALFTILREDYPQRDELVPHLHPRSAVQMAVPAVIGDYTDFYASIYHATNVGSMFRPANPLLPNYKWVPIAYHGRASSITVSGTPIRRPHGQVKADNSEVPEFGPSCRLDYELELGFYIGSGNEPGHPIPLSEAEQHAFGFSLVNDWSARDIQTWEYQPLGPFLAKNFATTISPWIVTAEALAPFRVPSFRRPEGDPLPLPYLLNDDDQKTGGFDITLEVYLATRQMRDTDNSPVRLSRGNFRDMYWTVAQMIAHHASNGCNLQPGDLMASGTVSGISKDSRGSLLELTWKGTEPLQLPTGESRRFLEDGDEVIMRGYCQREGAAHIGFGECRGTIIG